MKKTLLVCLSLAMGLLLGACSGTQAPDGGGSSPDKQGASEAEGAGAEKTTGTLECALASECDVEFSKLHYFAEDGASESYYVWCDEDMSAVEIIRVGYQSEAGLVEVEKLRGIETVRAGEAIQLDIVVPDGTPNLAIRYKSSDSARTYVPSHNGRDGGVYLVEADVVPASAGQDEAESDTGKANGTSDGSAAAGDADADADGAATGNAGAAEGANGTAADADAGNTAASDAGFSCTLHVVNDNVDGLVCQKKIIESSSAWHIWAALKRANPDIPMSAGLNSYKVVDGIGYLNLKPEIYNMNVGSMGETLVLQAIANTYIENTDAYKVAIQVDGKVYESGHSYLDEPISYNTVY